MNQESSDRGVDRRSVLGMAGAAAIAATATGTSAAAQSVKFNG